MKEFKSLANIWSFYDVTERKHFLSHDVYAAINSLPKDVLEGEACRYEAMAFGFSANCDGKEWGTYYGPQWTLKKKDTDEDIYVPDIRDISEEMMSYWEERAVLVKNPMLKARYTGLVLDFKKKLFGKDPDYKAIKLAHITALLDIVEGDYCQYETVAFDFAERALYLAIGLRNQDIQKRAIKAYYEAHLRYRNNDMHPGVWGRVFHSLIKHRPYFSGYETDIVEENITRYNRLYRLAMEEGEKTDRYAHVLSNQADLLADYYLSIGEPQKAEPYLDGILDAIRKSVAARGGMWGQGMLQQLQHRYRKYGFDRKANSLYVELSDLGEMTLAEMKTTEYSVPLDSERINAFMTEALDGDEKEVLLLYLYQYLPRLEEEKRKLKEKAERSPLLDMVSTIMIDSSGNALSRVGVGPNAEHQKLYFSMYENMRFTIPFMHLHVSKMKEEGKLTMESMMGAIEDSPLIAAEHKEIVRRGFEAYLAEDYLVCCHLLVPQLEAAIRRLFALNGANIMRPKANPVEGDEYLSLDSLLGSPEAITYMGEDIANYFRNVLTDQYGWNIRNQVSHGLLGADNFNFGMADRIVHAFLMLSAFKKKEVGGKLRQGDSE